jgi:uncharacterized protein YrrD
MQFKDGTPVYTFNGKNVGQIDKVVMNPKTKELSHIVVRKGLFFTEDKIVPLSLIASSNENGIYLRQDAGDLSLLPPFEEKHYIPLDERERSGTAYEDSSILYWVPPFGGWMNYPSAYAYPPPYPIASEQNIPEGTIALKEGATVYSSDNELLGTVERIFTDDKTDKASYFLLSDGLIFQEKKLIPMSWVGQITEDAIRLIVETSIVNRLVQYHPEKLR